MRKDETKPEPEPFWIDVPADAKPAEPPRWKITSTRSEWDVTFRVRVDPRKPAP